MAPASVTIYQGEDWSRSLSFYTSPDLDTPLVFDNPVMDIRAVNGSRLATFNEAGKEGTATITDPGRLLLEMDWTNTALLPAATYPVDIFADVDGTRKAILKKGAIQLQVLARITQDEEPVIP